MLHASYLREKEGQYVLHASLTHGERGAVCAACLPHTRRELSVLHASLTHGESLVYAQSVIHPPWESLVYAQRCHPTMGGPGLCAEASRC